MPRLFASRPFLAPSNAARPTLALLLATSSLVGCGTTKFSDTGRTATEQLLISSAMEDVVDEYDYSRLAGLKIHIKIANSTTDSAYLQSLVRQQLAANGAFVRDAADDADYILEVAPGAVGTNRYDLMYGIPETSIPAIGTLAATSIPEFALIKRTDQKAQVKLNMWAYNKTTGAIIWQSGLQTKSSNIRDRWFFGAGPFTNASYESGMRLGADKALPATIGERVSEDEKPTIQTGAVYQELDAAAIERLKKIREDGLAQALVEEKTAEAEQLGEVETDGADAETDATVEETPPAPETETVAAAPAPEPEPPKPAPIASVAATQPATRAVPAPPSVFPDDPDLTLDFGNGAALPLRSVYVPNDRIRR
ncbi:MAG: hypothetical protein IJO06_01470 [Thermoguttaceae bacterium]|nr:hypothetical protein [Thermoguttaceae bacterium]